MSWATARRPNHFHLILRPKADGDLGADERPLTAHARRYHRHYGTSGHVWQGRFKAFPIQDDDHLVAVLRYVELTPVRRSWWPGRKIGPGRACRDGVRRISSSTTAISRCEARTATDR